MKKSINRISKNFVYSTIILLILFNGINIAGEEIIEKSSAKLSSSNFSLNFNGNSYVNLPNSLVNNPSEFTIEAWVKPSTQGADNGMVFYHGAGGEIELEVGGDFTVSFLIHLDTWYVVYSNTKLPVNKWSHIAGVYKKSEQKIKIFINGVMDSYTSTPNISFIASGYTAMIGAYGNTAIQRYKGLIDEVRFSNIARYTNNFSTSTDYIVDANTIGLWKFNEGTENIVYDVSGRGNNGTIINAQWNTDTPSLPQNGLVVYYPFNGNANDESGSGNNGIITNGSFSNDRFGNINKALRFNGTSNPGYLRIPNTTNLQFNNSYSLSVWLFTSSTSGQDDGSGLQCQAVFAKQHDSKGISSVMGFKQNNTRFKYQQNYYTGSNPFLLQQDVSSYYPNQWQHLVYVITQSQFSLYINGVLTFNQACVTDLSITNQQDLYFGAYGLGSACNYCYPLNGLISDIRIFNKSLSFDEIQSLYHEGGWQKFTISATINPSTGGTITGSGVYDYGSSVLVVATPNNGYKFVSWTENGNIVSTSSSYSFTVTNNRNLVANFIPTTYTIATSSNPSASGNTSGGGVYNVGTNVTVVATPNSGYMFLNWTENGNIISTTLSYQFNVSANRNLVANFSTIPTLSVSPLYVGVNSNSGSGTFSVSNTTGGTMSWTASSNSNWLSITNSGSGINNGSINFSYQANNGSYRVGIITVTSVGSINSPQTVEVRQSQVVGVEEKMIPFEFMLYQNYPNPFNPATTINFDLPSAEFVTLKIYDLLGKEIKALVNEMKSPGKYYITLNASDLPSGILLYKISAGKYQETRKLILMK